MSGPCPCVDWCAITTPHSIHLSSVRKFRRGHAEWNISLSLIDGSDAPFLKIIYTGETETADLNWPLLLADVPDVAAYTARLREPEMAAAIVSTAALAGSMNYV